MNRFLPSIALIGLALISGCGTSVKQAVGTQPLKCQGTQRGGAVILAYYFEDRGLPLAKVAKRQLIITEADNISGAADTTDLKSLNEGAVYDDSQLGDSYTPCNTGKIKFTAYVDMMDGTKAKGTAEVVYDDFVEDHATAAELKMTMTAQ